MPVFQQTVQVGPTAGPVAPVGAVAAPSQSSPPALTREDYDRLYHVLAEVGVPQTDLDAAMPRLPCPDESQPATWNPKTLAQLQRRLDDGTTVWRFPNRTHYRFPDGRLVRPRLLATHAEVDGDVVAMAPPLRDVTEESDEKALRRDLNADRLFATADPLPPEGGEVGILVPGHVNFGPGHPYGCLTPDGSFKLEADDGSWWYASPWGQSLVAVPPGAEDAARLYLDAKAEREALKRRSAEKIALFADVIAGEQTVEALKAELANEEGADELVPLVAEVEQFLAEIDGRLSPLRARAAALRAAIPTQAPQAGNTVAGLGALGSRLSREVDRSRDRVVDEAARAAERVRAEAQRGSIATFLTVGVPLTSHIKAETMEFRKHILNEEADIARRLAVKSNKSQILSAFHQQDLKFISEMAAMGQRHQADENALRLRIAEIQARHGDRPWIRVVQQVHEVLKSIILNAVVPLGFLIDILANIAEAALDVHQARALKTAVHAEMRRVADEEEAVLQREIADLERELAERQARMNAARPPPAPQPVVTAAPAAGGTNWVKWGMLALAVLG